MSLPKNYTIQATWVWELVKTIYDQSGFTFRPSANIEFAVDESPAADEIIPVLEGEKNSFKKPKSFYVKGAAWDVVYIAPFDSAAGSTWAWAIPTPFPYPWTGTPESNFTSRQAWDQYLDTSLWILYFNNDIWVSTWRQVIQSA